MKLSHSQRQAVEHPGHLALESCPGSGKTRTLVARLLEAIDDVSDTTRLVACITYTNAAVHEIERRLAQLSHAAPSHCDVETLHSFCLKHIVAPHYWHLPNFAHGFSVVPPEDQVFKELVDGVIRRFGLQKKYARGDFEQLGRGTKALPDSIPEEAAEAFWSGLDERCLMDFSSIIYWAAKLVRELPYIGRGLASRYKWALVDEFQDTSSLQVDILRALHRHMRTTFFIVGDPHQSIMSFAGARPELFASFAVRIGAKTDVKLLDSYRSSENILRVADSLCPRARPTTAAGETRAHPHVPEWYGVDNMLDGVLNVFLPLVRKEAIPLAEAAVLAARWTSLLPLSRGLRERNIPSLGPGARPYKRSTHAIAPLVEEVAAYVSEPSARGVGQVRRELRRLVQTLTKAKILQLGFAGDVVAQRLIRTGCRLRSSCGSALDFLEGFAKVLAAQLHGAAFISKEDGQVLEQSARAMVGDIARHEIDYAMRTTTVRDLGLFARGSNSVRLLTMHGSKGREFDAVALVDVFDGHVPFYKAQPGDELEAEGRRVLYVAMTRARKLLMVFTLAKPTDRKQPSRFLSEVFPQGPAKRQS